MGIQSKKLLSVNEVAEILGVSRLTVYRKTENSEWPSIKLGSRRLLSAAFIDSIIETAYSTSEKKESMAVSGAN